MGDYTIICGNVLEVLSDFADDWFCGCLTDPPYGLVQRKGGNGGFMSQKWDAQVPPIEDWEQVLRVLKPGASLLSFGGTRTVHRLVCAIEDAGFEIKDQICWLYGVGFPKSRNAGRSIDKLLGNKRPVINEGKATGKQNSVIAINGSEHGYNSARFKRGFKDGLGSEESTPWEGYGTQLKPSYEPITAAMKSMSTGYAENALKYGVAGINIDGTRVATDWSDRPDSWKRSGHSAKPEAKKIAAPPGIGINCHELGRWPANLISDEDSAAALDEQTSDLKGRSNKVPSKGGGGMYGHEKMDHPFVSFNDSGGASRFFYSAKVSSSERNAGLEINAHPTLKPIDLCRYLATLILPPRVGKKRRLLVPYCGTGSEMIGALIAGWDEVVGIEQSQEYVDIAHSRIAHWCPESHKK